MNNNSLVVSAFHIPENALRCMYVTAIVHCNSTGFEHVVGMACRVHGGTAATPSAALFVEGRFNYEKRGCRLKNENCYSKRLSMSSSCTYMRAHALFRMGLLAINLLQLAVGAWCAT